MAARSTAPPVRPWSPRSSLERIGHLLSRAILTVVYALLVAPVGALYRLLADPLRLARRGPSTWGEWRSRNDSVERAREQG